ncbi:hypothetical protein KW807_00430 [Candidatus Parcubacteria bacterium]|nr:hypothetical protein [Candidatus Parcubacteria bacterium]
MLYDRTCQTCEKDFRSQRKESNICYGCALTRLIGNGGPEEGDINTALLTSGEMSDEDAHQLQRDLESVDHSAEEAFERQFEDYYGPDDCYLDDDEEWTR